MNNKIANIIVDYIKDLTWIDKLAGLTQVARIRQTSGDSTVEKRFPISCSMAFDETCVEGCYDELAPNSAYQSVVYFEDGSFVLQKTERNKKYYESSLRLVAWLNYKKLGGGCGSTGDYIIDIIKALPATPVNNGDMLGLFIEVVSQVPRSINIFSQYTYNETQAQYFMLPYDAFALEIRTRFYVIAECVEPEPAGCIEC